MVLSLMNIDVSSVSSVLVQCIFHCVIRQLSRQLQTGHSPNVCIHINFYQTIRQSEGSSDQ